MAFEVGAVQRCVDRVSPEVSVRSVVCVHGVDVPADPDGALGAVVLCGPEELDAVVTEFPDVDVGSYPRWTDPKIRTKLTFDARDRAACERAREAFVARLPEGALAGLEG